MKLGRKAEFLLNNINRPKHKPLPKKMINLSNNQAAYGKYKDYPETILLYQAFAREWNDWGVSNISNVLPTSGAEEALRFVFSALVESGTKVLRADPVFGMIEYFEQMNRAEAIKIDYIDPVYKFNIEYFIRAMLEHKNEISLIYLASPDNPTGSMLNENDLVHILNNARDLDIPVVLDFTYLRFSPDYSPKRINLRKYPNIIIIDSLSKSHGLAGLRVGAIIANPEFIDIFTCLRPINEVNSVAAEEAVTALFSNIAEKNKKHADKWKDKFEHANILNAINIMTNNNTIMLYFENDKHIYFYHKLLKYNIQTRIEFTHPCMKNILRISIGNNKVMRKVLRLLQESK